MRFEILKTDRLTIRRLTIDDAKVLAAYRSVPSVSRFQSSWSLAKAEELIQEMAASDPGEKGKWFQFGVELNDEARLIGDIGFLNFDENQKSWIGFTIDPQYQRRGFGAEAVRAVLYYYSKIGISSVWASTDPENTPSSKLLGSLGFARVLTASPSCSSEIFHRKEF